jgi:hypothetical protein
MQLVGESYSVDKTGAATAVVSWFVARGESTIVGGLPGSFRGLPRTKIESKQQEDGSYIATGTYEGQAEESAAGGASYADREGKVYEWSPTFEQTDIAKHPRIAQLLQDYEGEADENGNIIWPQTLGGEGGEGLGEDSAETVNPMFGVNEFLSLGGVWSETSLQGDIPEDVFSSIGGINSSVPGGLVAPDNRFWLTMPPIIVEHGNRWKVTRRWMLSGVASARDVQAAQDIYGSGETE